MKVLFLAFEFPPLSCGGVYRPLAFLKYLPEYGIEPVVITTDEESYRHTMVNPPLDHSLLERVPARVPVYRIPCVRSRPTPRTRFSEWKRIFFSLVEGAPKAWAPNLLSRIEEIFRQHHPELIFATAPPFYVATLACRIARKLSIPLVLDLRDAWSQWRIGPYGSFLHYLLTVRMEGACLKGAERIIVTSRQTRVDFLKVHPEVPGEKIKVITNGYDRAVEEWEVSLKPKSHQPFVIGYVGTFYYSPAERAAMMQPWWCKAPNRMIQYAPRKEDWLYRSPYFFFQAVAALLAENPQYRSRLRIRFAGSKPDWIDEQVNRFGLAANVEFLGPLNHSGSLQFQSQCDALLVTSSKVLGGGDYSIAGKTFEYFSMRKPVLGFVAEGAQKELLAESGLALLCDPDVPSESARKLRDLLDGHIGLTPNVPFLRKLHRRQLTGQLAIVLREAAGSRESVSAKTASAAITPC